MKINTKIPGWNSEPILRVLAEYAANVPENGNILELGALFGRSTYTLGHNKKESVKITTIDFWPTINCDNHRQVWFHDEQTGPDELRILNEKIIRRRPGEMEAAHLPGDEFFNLWKHFTAGIANLEGIRGNTSMTNEHLPQFDFIFHDAAHDYDGVYDDLVHWFPKLKQDCVMIIDDYDAQFPGVIKAVDQYVLENNLLTEMVTPRNILIRRKI